MQKSNTTACFTSPGSLFLSLSLSLSLSAYNDAATLHGRMNACRSIGPCSTPYSATAVSYTSKGFMKFVSDITLTKLPLFYFEAFAITLIPGRGSACQKDTSCITPLFFFHYRQIYCCCRSQTFNLN